jgi:hypothetical protein
MQMVSRTDGNGDDMWLSGEKKYAAEKKGALAWV